MTRPHDWSVFRCDSDPIPGCPDTVETFGRQYVTTAQNLEQASRRLQNLGDSSLTKSEAVTKLLQQATDMGSKLDKIACRYQEAGSALTIYAPALRQAQEDSLRAWRAADEASERCDQLTHSRNDVIQRWASSAGSGQSDDAFQSELEHVNQQSAQAETSLESARRLLEDAIAHRDAAANTAADRIDSAVENSSVNDTVWDHIQEGWEAFNKFMDEWGWLIDIVLLALSVALMFVPGGQLVSLAIWALKVAKTAWTVASTLHTLDGMVRDASKGDWLGVGLSGLTLIPFAGKATKALPKGMKNSSAGKFASKILKPGDANLRSALPSAQKAIRAQAKLAPQVWGAKITNQSYVRWPGNAKRYYRDSLDVRRLRAADEMLGGKRFTIEAANAEGLDFARDRVLERPSEVYDEYRQSMPRQAEETVR